MLSVLTFWWFNRLAMLGYRRPQTDDMWELQKPNKTENIIKEFNVYCDERAYSPQRISNNNKGEPRSLKEQDQYIASLNIYSLRDKSRREVIVWRQITLEAVILCEPSTSYRF